MSIKLGLLASLGSTGHDTLDELVVRDLVQRELKHSGRDSECSEKHYSLQHHISYRQVIKLTSMFLQAIFHPITPINRQFVILIDKL